MSSRIRSCSGAPVVAAFLFCLLISPAARGQEGWNVTRVGQVMYWDAAGSMAVQGDYAFPVSGYMMHVLDVSDPQTLHEISYLTLTYSVVDIALDGDYAYLATAIGMPDIYKLLIVDIADPFAPSVAGSCYLDDLPACIGKAGNYAYLVASNRLMVVDVTNPIDPQFGGDCELSVYGNSIAISGSIACVGGQGGLSVVDLGNPAAPVEVGSSSFSYYLHDLVVSGDHLYAVDYWGLYIVDISDPANPEEVGRHVLIHPGITIGLWGNYAYVTTTGEELAILDVSNPQLPSLVQYMPIENGAEHLAISAGTAYILPSSAPGLSAYGLSVPAQPELLGAYLPQSDPNFVSLQGDYAYVTTGNGLQILYISNPSSPQQVGLWDAGEAPPLVVAVGGSYAYLAGGNELKVIDISDPMNPTRIDTSYAGWSGFIGQDIELSGNLCYTLCGGAIIRAWDISDPLLPLETAVFMLPGPAGGMDLAGNYAYIANENYGLRILDISNPDTLIEAGILHTPDEANDVAIAGNFAYVGCDYDGLRIVDISNPTEPVLRGNLYAPGMYPEFLHVEVIGQHAFVACAWEGLAVVNIANPDYPYLVGTHSALGYSDALAVADNHAFAIEDNFLSIYDCSAAVPVEPETPPVQPASFILHPSHPNPFNASTVLSFQLPVPSWVKLEVFDINGRLVGAHRSAPMSGSETTPTTEFFPAGTRRITFNGSDLPSGIYLARLTAGNFNQTQKLVLLK